MANNKGQVKTGRFDQVEEPNLIMRLVNVRDQTANNETRTVDVVVATENPVERYDAERGIVLHEVLSMGGVEFRGGKNQLPIVDSHDRSSVANVLGSVRRLRVEDDELVGEASFASDERSQEAFAKLRDGHLTDFSITASPKEIGFVERGKTYTTRRGDVVSGPADVVTRWVPTDASLVATGADERSVVRRSYTDIPSLRKRAMDESLIQSLVAMGLPVGLTYPNALLAWVVGNMNAVTPTEESEPVVELAEPTISEEEQPVEDEVMNEEKPEEEVTKAVDRALQDDRERQKEIRAICEKVGIERAVADALCDSGASLDKARSEVINRMAEISKPIGGTADPRVVESADDKFAAAASDGLIQRAVKAAHVRAPAFEEGHKPAPGADDFANMDLFRIAEACVRQAGINTQQMSRKDVAMVAMGHPGTINRLRIQREAYHSTGTFTNLMLDAANKTLRAGYEEAIYTWSIWARQGASAPDMKALNRIQFSEFPNLEMVPENHAYPEKAMTDAKESYKVEKFGAVFSITWETVVNDDLDAISRVPAMQGNAARRTQNAKVYEVLTANAAMSDGNALFSASHASGSNLQTSGAAPSEATLNAGFTAMALQKGLNSTVSLNITPRFLIVPRALEATALTIVASSTPPTAGGSAVGTSGYQSLYGPGGSRQLTVVSDAVLDGNSSVIWYLAASPSEVDTVELTFLAGEETPVLENEWEMLTDCWNFKIRQTFAAKAIDWRGLYENDGA